MMYYFSNLKYIDSIEIDFLSFIVFGTLLIILVNKYILEKASWSSGNAFVSGAGGLRFKSRAGQIGHSVANGSPPLRRFFKRSCVARVQ